MALGHSENVAKAEKGYDVFVKVNAEGARLESLPAIMLSLSMKTF